MSTMAFLWEGYLLRQGTADAMDGDIILLLRPAREEFLCNLKDNLGQIISAFQRPFWIKQNGQQVYIKRHS